MSQAIANKIFNILVEFDIETKTIAMITDNGSNMVASANILKSRLNTFTHYRCIAHILNLVVTAGLGVVNLQIKKLNKIKFLRLILDCKIRWNSTYKMISRACVLKENMQMLLVKNPYLTNFFL